MFLKFESMCAKNGISVARAAKEIGLSNSASTTWKKNPDLLPDGRTLLKIALYFGVPVSDLLSSHELLTAYLRRRKEAGTLPEPDDQLLSGAYSLSDDELSALASRLGVSSAYLFCLYDNLNPHRINGLEIPPDDLTAALPLHGPMLALAPEGRTQQEKERAPGAEAPSADVADAMDRIASATAEEKLAFLKRLFAEGNQ